MHITLLTFQFDRHGGGLVIEAARCAPEGVTIHWGAQISPDKVKAWDLHRNERKRIKPRLGDGTESWFRFDGDKSVVDVASEVLDELRRSLSES